MYMKEILKSKYIKIALIISIILSLFCIFKIVEPNKEYEYYGGAYFEAPNAVSGAVIYEHVAVPMGVYEVCLEYDTNTKLDNYCYVQDGTVFTNGLLTNGQTFYGGLYETGFQMWLFERTEELQICANFCGNGYLDIGNLVIRETNYLWTLLLLGIFCVVLVSFACAYYKIYDEKVGIDKERKTVFFWLLMIILISSMPYTLGKVISGADLGYHLHRIEGVADGIRSGQFPLRLEPEWVHGHGYANAIFYCNTLLYFPGILRLLGFTVLDSYNAYGIALNVATTFVSYYCFSRIFKSRYIGLLCSALYSLSIFRLYKLMITCAVGEGSAVTFMPLVLYGLYRVFSEDHKSKEYKTAWIPIAVGYAGLFQTHVLSCEITAFLTILVCLIFIKKIFRKETFWELAKGAGSAIAISFWYLVPFLDYFVNEDLHIRHVSARTIQDRGLYLPQLLFHWWEEGTNALAGDSGMYQSHAVGVGFVLVLGFIVFCILWFSGLFGKEEEKILGLGKFSVFFGGLLMLMSLNIFPWDRIQFINSVTASLVSSLQFPNRFLGWGTVFLIAIAGCLLWFFKREDKWKYYLTVVIFMVGLVTSSLYLLNHLCLSSNAPKIYNVEGMGLGYISGAEYVVEGTDYEHLYYGDPVVSKDIVLFEYEKEYLHVDMSCSNDGPKEGYIELPMLCYTGYHAFTDTEHEELEVVKGDNNVIRVLIPEGFRGNIDVKFVSPWYWRLSEVVTYAWWLGLITICIAKKIKNRKKLQEVDYA